MENRVGPDFAQLIEVNQNSKRDKPSEVLECIENIHYVHFNQKLNHGCMQ